jgi:hypothetical protein
MKLCAFRIALDVWCEGEQHGSCVCRRPRDARQPVPQNDQVVTATPCSGMESDRPIHSSAVVNAVVRLTSDKCQSRYAKHDQQSDHT